MANIDFPSSPTVGQTYSFGGITYTYTAQGIWNPSSGVGGGVRYTASTTPPVSANPGDQWYDLTIGALSIYVSDGNSSQWVQVFPTGASVAPVGSMVLIQSQIVSVTVPTVDFATGIDSTYDQYVLEFFNVHPTVEAQLNLQISQDGGSTWKGDASYQMAGPYVGAVGAPAWLQATGQAGLILAIAGLSTLTNGAQSGTVKFWRPTAAEFHMFMIDSLSHNSGLSFARYSGVGCYAGNTLPINGIRFYAPGTTIVSGTFKLYGIKK